MPENENKMLIYIYHDYGVHPACSGDTEEWLNTVLVDDVEEQLGVEKSLVDIQYVNANDLKKGVLKDNNPDALFIPGGNAIDTIMGLEKFEQFPEPNLNASKEERAIARKPVAKYINDLENGKETRELSEAQENIESYIKEQGGIVCGTCSGAYILSDIAHYEYAGDKEDLKITSNSNVKVGRASAKAHGEPHNYIDTPDYYAETIVDYSNGDGLTQAQPHCNTGPYFENLGENVCVMARYAITQDQLTKEGMEAGKNGLYPEKPCLIKEDLGKGRMIVMGVHPEFQKSTILERGIPPVDRLLSDNLDDRQEGKVDFSKAVVLNEIIHILKHRHEYGEKPEKLPELSDKGLGRMLEERKNPVPQSNKPTAKEVMNSLPPSGNVMESVMQPKSEAPKQSLNEKPKQNPLQKPKPPIK
ncbi:MAG: BPL-N domain-containing protein [Alphaproteobacteria bacterium]|jgi:glutamine amidotransferase-like uncharacterized protein|nr:BPL-N domain-containing protein [Alphaproteobacteria bacterium]